MAKEAENSEPVLKLTRLVKTLMRIERELVAFSPVGAKRVPKENEVAFAAKLSELVETSVEIEKTALTFRVIAITRSMEPRLPDKRAPK